MRLVKENGHIFEEWLTPSEIDSCVQAVADQISADFKNREPLFVIVLNGAFVFGADLLRKVNLRCEVTFIRVKSYTGMNSTGTLEYLVPLQQSVEGRDVILIEDVIDSGLTIHYLKKHMSENGAASVRTVSMLFKPEALKYDDAEPDYVAKLITKEFVIGYGLDYDGWARNLDAIYRLKE